MDLWLRLMTEVNDNHPIKKTGSMRNRGKNFTGLMKRSASEKSPFCFLSLGSEKGVWRKTKIGFRLQIKGNNALVCTKMFFFS